MKIQKKFCPGEEWMYFKLYTNQHNSDLLLSAEIKQLTHYLYDNNYIDKWFYILFSEPESSIRLRLHLINNKDFSNVMTIFHTIMHNKLDSEIISKFILDTYDRELMRYGIETISFSESLFEIDSNQSIEFISYYFNYPDFSNIKWIYTLLSTHFYTYTLIQEDKARIDFVETMNLEFLKEFGYNKYNLKDLNAKYREANLIIAEFLLNASSVVVYKILEERSSKIIKLLQDLPTEQKNNFMYRLSDFIHMSIIRIHYNNRFYELIAYNFLSRIYKSHMVRYGEIRMKL
jgi:thiopeptide-type bacteriocin biosynthesis protein